MTAYRFATLTCDKCGQIYDPGTEIYVRRVRALAATNGWVLGWDTNRRRIDICGVCNGTHYRDGHGDSRNANHANPA